MCFCAAEFSAGEVATQVDEQTARTKSCAAQSGQLAKNQQDLVELLRLIKSSHHGVSKNSFALCGPHAVV